MSKECNGRSLFDCSGMRDAIGGKVLQGSILHDDACRASGTGLGWLANHTPTVHAAEPTSAFLLLESVPETKRLITCASDNDLAIWTHGKVEHTVGVARQRHHLLHARVLPHDNLVLAVTMSRHNLVTVLRPCEVAHLAAGV
jgi:hypothetical protein